MKFIKYFILILTFYQVPIFSQRASDIVTYKDNFEFAKSLYRERDYLRAAGEFEKTLFYLPSFRPAFGDSLLFWIGKSYRKGEEFNQSNVYLKKIYTNNSDLYHNGKLLMALNYFNLEKFDSSIGICNLNFLKNNKDIQYKFEQLKLVNLILLKKYAQARKCLSNEVTPNAVFFKQLIDKGQNSKKKMPVFAGILSAVIPGSGKVYTKRSLDGLYSFLVIGITTWRAYEGYQSSKMESVDFWVFGSMATYFYLGNIYGSAISAKIFNENIDDEIKNRLEVFVNVNL